MHEFKEVNPDNLAKEGVDILVQPKINHTPKTRKPTQTEQSTPYQSLRGNKNIANPRIPQESVHLSQNQLYIEKNLRTPINEKHRNNESQDYP
jgi:hypothetical protein